MQLVLWNISQKTSVSGNLNNFLIRDYVRNIHHTTRNLAFHYSLYCISFSLLCTWNNDSFNQFARVSFHFPSLHVPKFKWFSQNMEWSSPQRQPLTMEQFHLHSNPNRHPRLPRTNARALWKCPEAQALVSISWHLGLLLWHSSSWKYWKHKKVAFFFTVNKLGHKVYLKPLFCNFHKYQYKIKTNIRHEKKSD